MSKVGYKQTREHIEKNRQARLKMGSPWLIGKKKPPHTPEAIEKMRLGHKGAKAWNKGIPMSESARLKLSVALKGRVTWNKGLKTPQFGGKNHYLWIEDRNKVIEKHRIRGTTDWKNWRTAVFTRDNFTCKECGTTKVYIEPHHIIPIRSDWSKLFDTNNGITLCRPCHKKTMWREEEFAEKYTAILTIA